VGAVHGVEVGDRFSVFHVSPVGEAGTFDCSYKDEVWVMGPMVSLGLTYRFGF
jgi:hypothetical protein